MGNVNSFQVMWVKLVISVGLPPLPTDKEAKAAPNACSCSMHRRFQRHRWNMFLLAMRQQKKAELVPAEQKNLQESKRRDYLALNLQVHLSAVMPRTITWPKWSRTTFLHIWNRTASPQGPLKSRKKSEGRNSWSIKRIWQSRTLSRRTSAQCTMSYRLSRPLQGDP